MKHDQRVTGSAKGKLEMLGNYFDISEDFPMEKIVAVGGDISGSQGKYSFTIQLQPFELEEEFVDQKLQIDNVPLNAESIEGLAGQTFLFPSNPEDGYVETSIYICTSHNPIDVRSISFGDFNGETISAIFDLYFVFEYEGVSKNAEKKLVLDLKVRN